MFGYIKNDIHIYMYNIHHKYFYECEVTLLSLLHFFIVFFPCIWTINNFLTYDDHINTHTYVITIKNIYIYIYIYIHYLLRNGQKNKQEETLQYLV